jgi:sugar lactone lactonase YvrE
MTVSAKSRIISTLAGNGEPGHSGDDGPATAACLNEPKSLAVDQFGNVYIADSENHVVRKVDRATGRITTIAGAAVAVSPENAAVTGVGVEDTGEEDPLADSSTSRSQSFTQLADLSGTVRYVVNGASAKRFQGDEGLATKAVLNFPTAVAVDAAGHVYIADTMNHRVRRVDAATGIISTIAGNGQARYSGDGGPAVSAALNEPMALVADAFGHLYIADQNNNRVRIVDLTTGVIETAAGNGVAAYNGDGIPAVEASLAGPSGLALGPGRELYVADMFNGRIRMVDRKTDVISTVVGDGGEYRYQNQGDSPSASLARPYGIAVDRQGHIFITDSDNHLVRRWDREQKLITRVVGTGIAGFGGDGGPGEGASLRYPFGITIDRDGAILIADTFNHRIRLLVQ